MTIAACAAIVERGDPDRFLAAMAAPAGLRGRLFVLYAFNLEVARAPWITRERLIAQMRLQWWRDCVAEAVAGAAPRAHEVAGPLAGLIREAALPGAVLSGMIDAREWDIEGADFASEEEVIAHVDRGAGSLLLASALALGADPGQETALREAALAGGIANWLMAVPALEAAGKRPLAHATLGEVRGLARYGLDMLARHRATDFGAAVPALRAHWRAEPLLRAVLADPQAVPEGRLGQSEFRRRTGLMWKSLRGGW